MRHIAFAVAACHLACLAGSIAQGGEAADIEFFEKSVRPLLVERCFECHSADNAESDLQLDSRSGMLAGGERGPAILPGKPEASLLVSAINHGEVLQMPPKVKLAPQQIALIAEWIKRGAPWPGDEGASPAIEPRRPGNAVTDEDRQFWSFQRPIAQAPPEVNNEAWARSAVDRFVLARLEAAGLRPAPPAERRLLLRRVTYDLIGLPPTVEEIEAFLSDDSPDAFEKVVNRLLDSPQYGERWGRHWLDVARYADSNGMDENYAFEHAFRYRDYVIAAFNSDKPYDQFVREQLAGDLLADTASVSQLEQYDRLIATGFLSIGPKMLADDDQRKKEMDIIDEQLDTLGKAFLGMTVGCARCHDHKFDPIPAADYYALAGILKSTKTMENFVVVAEWHEHTLETDEERQHRLAHEAKIAEAQKRIEERKKEDPESEATKQAVATLEEEKKQLESERPKPAKAMGVREGQPQNLKVHLRGSHTTLGEESPRHMLRVIAGDDPSVIDGSRSGRLELADWIASAENPLTSRVMVNRIWRWHFGKGIVPTVDNFGRLGDPPTHPELLDFLALEFERSGWSIKAMHRMLLLSNSYQMSTRFDAEAAAVDPENKLYWRFDRRRLAAEEVRDSLLTVSGRLDPAMGGSFSVFSNREYVTNPGRLAEGYKHTRRSVYLPVYRSAVYDVLQAFDFADPSTLEGNRPTTTVAPQALFMMNSDIMGESAAALASRLLAEEHSDEAARLQAAYRAILGRSASAADVAKLHPLLDELAAEYAAAGVPEGERAHKAWRSVCRVLLSTNEFIYVE
jgi:hypothetical protein